MGQTGQPDAVDEELWTQQSTVGTDSCLKLFWNLLWAWPHFSDVCGRGSDQLLQLQDVSGRPGDQGGSCVHDGLTATRAEGTHALHRHTATE